MSETPEGSKIAEIIINTTAKRLQQTFSYIVPDHLDVRIGSRVLVPFGHRREEGIVVALREHLDEAPAFELKPIEGLLSMQTGFQSTCGIKLRCPMLLPIPLWNTPSAISPMLCASS